MIGPQKIPLSVQRDTCIRRTIRMGAELLKKTMVAVVYLSFPGVHACIS